MRIALLSLLLLFSATAAATPYTPLPFAARYSVHYDSFRVGILERSLSTAGSGGWRLRAEMYPTGFIALLKKDRFVEESLFQPQPDGTLRPLRYRYTHTDGQREKQERLEFDWTTGLFDYHRNNAQSRHPLPEDGLDKLLVQVALKRDLAAGLREMHYTVVEDDEVERYHFRVVGEEMLETALGRLRTLKVERVREDKKRNTVFWAAVEREHLLVKIVQEEDGHTYASRILETGH